MSTESTLWPPWIQTTGWEISAARSPFHSNAATEGCSTLKNPRLALPIGVILGAEIDQQQSSGVPYGQGDLGQKEITGGVDPVEVVNEHDDGLGFGASLEKTPQEGE